MPCASRLRGILPAVFFAILAGCDRVVPTASDLVAIDANPLFVSTGSTNVPETSVIRVADFTFSPNYVMVKQGGSIVWEFEGPKGTTSIRENDHALIQPMFTATLKQDGDTWVPELVDTVPADQVAPPEASGK